MKLCGCAQARRKRGFVLIATAAAIVVAIGCLGLSVDLGRMYIAKSEAQAYVDSAAMAAALQLDGTTDGIARARAAVSANTNTWNLETTNFSDPTVEFAQSAGGPWAASPDSANLYAFARVRTTVGVGLYFMPVVVSNTIGTVGASAIAGQVPMTTFREGLFPFSPFAHNNIGPDFGLTRGTNYTLRWASNPRLGASNVCPGDQDQRIIDIAQAQGGSERGFIEDTSASLIRATIVDDYQTIIRSIGDIVTMTGGSKQTELTSLQDRISQDTDTTSQTFDEYVDGGNGNGRRIVAVPINDGGTPVGTDLRIVQIAGFFLHSTADYGNGGGQAWCGEFIGAWVEGMITGGAGATGAYVVRLVQ